MATKVLLDEDVQQLVRWLQEKEAARGNPGMSDARAANWLAREGARALKVATPTGKKVPRG